MRYLPYLLTFLIASVNAAEVNRCTVNGKVLYTALPCPTGAATTATGIYLETPRISTNTTTVQNLTITRSKYGSFYVPGNVDGVDTYFQIDTGAEKTTLSAKTAYKLGIKTCQQAGTSDTAAGSTPYCEVIVKHLSVHNYHFYNVKTTIIPAMSEGDLLGADLLSQFKIYQDKQTMTLSR